MLLQEIAYTNSAEERLDGYGWVAKVLGVSAVK
jgi:hypothetical protein